MFSKHPIPQSLPQSITLMIVIKWRLSSKRAIDARFCSRSSECFHSAKYSTFVHFSNEHNSIFHQNIETSAKCNHRKHQRPELLRIVGQFGTGQFGTKITKTDNLAPGVLVQDNLARDNLAPGQFGTKHLI